MKIHRETLDGDRPAYYASERAEINTGGITLEFAFVDYILEVTQGKKSKGQAKDTLVEMRSLYNLSAYCRGLH